MNTVLMIIGIHAALVGMALVFAGFVLLIAPTAEEQEAMREIAEAERAKGLWHYTIFCVGEAYAARVHGIVNAVSHWRKQPQARKLIYGGAACLAIAVLIGIHLGAFKS